MYLVIAYVCVGIAAWYGLARLCEPEAAMAALFVWPFILLITLIAFLSALTERIGRGYWRWP